MNDWRIGLSSNECIYRDRKQGCSHSDNPLTQIKNGNITEHGPCTFSDCPLAVDSVEDMEVPF